MINRPNIIIAAIWAIVILFMALAYQISSYDVLTISVLLSIGAILIIVINWHAHSGGRNASFIFLILGLVFLCGRALPVLLGGDSQLAIIGFGTAYKIESEKVMTYAMLVLASFFFVHVGSLLPRAHKLSLRSDPLDAKFYLFAFILFLPVLIYKNIYYFNYIMNNGGYLAIYQGGDHLDGVGFLSRLGSLFCLSGFALYFFHENDQKKSRFALMLFVIVFSSELLVGLRGKFFATILVLFLFYKLRYGGKFSLPGLLAMLITIITIAIFVEIMREQKTESLISNEVLIGFLAQQGVSAGVSLLVIDEPYFIHNGTSYFWHQFLAPFISQPDVPQGWFLANDISIMIMPDAYALGFGTGSSYLAELILLGGIVGLLAGSLMIGWFLSVCSRFYQGVSGAIIFWVVIGLVYYPRTMLHDPVHNLIRYSGPIIFLVFCRFLLRRWGKLREH